MTGISLLSDLARLGSSAQMISSAQQQIQQHSKELVTGISEEKSARLNGDFKIAAAWQREINIHKERQKALSETAGRLEAKAIVYESITNELTSAANDIALATTSTQPTSLTRGADQARNSLDSVMSKINTSFAGVSLFSGTSFDASTLISSDDLLAIAKTLLTGATSPADADSRLDAWFDDLATGYGNDAYNGSLMNNATARLSDFETIEIPGRADDQNIRDSLKALAKAALATDADLGFSLTMQQSMLESASVEMRRSSSSLVETHAQVGYLQGRVENAEVSAAAQVSAYQMVRLDTYGVEQTDAATSLQSAQAQLEKLFALTARNSRLSLLEYLK